MFDNQSTNMNNFDFDNSYTGDNGINYNEIDINMIQNNNTPMMENSMTPISECPQERQIHRTIMHEVPQD